MHKVNKYHFKLGHNSKLIRFAFLLIFLPKIKIIDFGIIKYWKVI